MFLVLFRFLTSKHLIYQCKFNLSLSMKGPHASSYQQLYMLTKLSLSQSVMTVSITVKPHFSIGIAERLKCGPEVIEDILQLRKKSHSSIRLLRVLKSLISYKDIILFKRLSNTVADDWACLLVLSVSDDNELVAQLPRTQFYLSETLCSKHQPPACPVLICF